MNSVVMQPKPTQQELDQARLKCNAEYVQNPGGHTPKLRYSCYLPAYLKARHEYHKLLVAAGMLDPKLAEPEPYLEELMTPVIPVKRILVCGTHLQFMQWANNKFHSTKGRATWHKAAGRLICEDTEFISITDPTHARDLEPTDPPIMLGS